MLQVPQNVSFEIIGNEVLVYAGDHGSVTRLSGEVASVFREVAENPGRDYPDSHSLQQLVEAGLIQKVSGSGMSRRSALKVVGAGAGVGALTLALPVAAAASSVAPSGVWSSNGTDTTFQAFPGVPIDIANANSKSSLAVLGFTFRFDGSNATSVIFFAGKQTPGVGVASIPGTLTYDGVDYAITFVEGTITR